MQLSLLAMALNLALLARIARSDDGNQPDQPQPECESDVYPYVQCVFFEGDDDPRGTYDADTTSKACADFPHGDGPAFEFVAGDKACEDKEGIKNDQPRLFCNADFASACFQAGGGEQEDGYYGSNAGHTLDEMYSYADEGGKGKNKPPKKKHGKEGGER
ncbi:hypothetical protein Tdes44962_MAKER06048 [Teratosphaeria destructans]|uniref:Uncharacterized protein n=1 Tax=Teratosphaeria destructans TaxID=418781 RepID=A0A9W7VY64_9PEZI|nr:hypothetical protein Tdes44962_MAKER06048 [Teratosphaeria destructans]